ncbi:DUF1878 family protein [Virgibacillus sp. C22-A2]|uniref:DUF1878 family protein n=1 Tax=Virgibacillus tibetensis TaxID=3042313 RepID=A0ABU6KEW1_9BACI|nr:DUF1878 family protein [Virgibacillus sp. C22-A2]
MKGITDHATSFHLKLLSGIMDMNEYPVIKLMIEKNITNEEYDELFNMLHVLNSDYEEQKEEGFLDFTSLLLHFAGMLNERLEPNETIYALKKEGYFPAMLTEFIHIIDTGIHEHKR